MSIAAPQDDYLDRVLSKLYPAPNPYLEDPVGWVRDKLQEFFWSKQREIVEALVTHRYVAVKSAHDTGKSHSASRVVAWWEDTREDPFATTTAPTTKQVHAILWRYIGQAHRKGNLIGRITLDDEWYAGPGGKELVGFGRKPADHDQSAFQGIHALNPLVVIDESGGVPKSIFDAVDALATNTNARVLAIGNPDDPGTHFAQICKPGSGWHVITVDGLATPNFTREAVEPFPALAAYMEREGIPYSTEEVPDDLRPLLISPEWVDERIKRWGINSPLFASKVRGEFPQISDDTLIMPKWIEAAQQRELPKNQRPRFAADIARMGEDETVAMRRDGGQFRVVWAAHKLSTMETVGHLCKILTDAAGEIDIQEVHSMQIDADGLGAGVFDRMIELDREVADFHGGMPAIDSDRFANRRAECYWMLRELFEQGEIDIDPHDDVLAAQLGSLKWALTSRGQIKIESKDDMRKRGMPSPDRADACIAEGTLIVTRNGEIPIEQVSVGDEVATRAGWQKVKATGLTALNAEVMEIEVNDTTLQLTPDHRVFTTNRGFIRADALMMDDRLLVWTKHQSQSCLTDTDLQDRPTRNTDQRGCTTPLTRLVMAVNERKASANSILKFGRQQTPTRRFLQTGLSITSTMTRLITIPTIWRASLAKSMRRYITSTMTTTGDERTWTRHASLRLSGTAHQKVLNGTLRTAGKFGSTGKRSLLPASNAEAHLSPTHQAQQSFATSIATTGTRQSTRPTTSRNSVQCAEVISYSTEPGSRLKPAVVSVVRSLEKRQNVYDLSVDGQPEFIAGGILVHNCMMLLAVDDSYVLTHVSDGPQSIAGDLLTAQW